MLVRQQFAYPLSLLLGDLVSFLHLEGHLLDAIPGYLQLLPCLAAALGRPLKLVFIGRHFLLKFLTSPAHFILLLLNLLDQDPE